MNRKRIALLTIIILLTVILISITSALSAGNTVPATRLSDQGFATTISDLAPPECAGLDLTNIVVVTGWLTSGTDAGDLILGRNTGDVIFGGLGEDCIVSGGGNDSLYGSEGTNDVCIGGPGNDTFPNTFLIIFPVVNGCETKIQ
jgi:Ca2+-binding RTX toxin-like protein